MRIFWYGISNKKTKNFNNLWKCFPAFVLFFVLTCVVVFSNGTTCGCVCWVSGGCQVLNFAFNTTSTRLLITKSFINSFIFFITNFFQITSNNCKNQFTNHLHFVPFHTGSTLTLRIQLLCIYAAEIYLMSLYPLRKVLMGSFCNSYDKIN